MFLALPFFHPFLAWTWITSLNIIDAFHFGLSHPYSYHYIPYFFHVEVQHALCIPLVQLAINPSNIVA
jgi:hypothetical protein